MGNETNVGSFFPRDKRQNGRKRHQNTPKTREITYQKAMNASLPSCRVYNTVDDEFLPMKLNS
jgi:hypothetical protein